MKARITKRAIDGLEPQAGRPAFLWDTDVTGFGCKATPAGRKVYLFQYRMPGQSGKTAPKRITLGRHGDLTPDQARRLAAQLSVEARSGRDPTLSRRSPDVPTVADLAERFLKDFLPAKKRPPRKTTIQDYERIFRCHVVPRLGKKSLEEVTPYDIEALHSSMRATPYQANRLLSVLRQAFNQAERWGWRPQGSNPSLHIDRYPEARRGAKKEVMLTSEQMADLLRAIDEEEEAGASLIACAAIRLAFWTGWRIGEVLSLEWSNLRLDLGQARLLRTKTAPEEYRQLPSEALTVLEQLPRVEGCPYVFPGHDLCGHLTTVRKPWVRIRARAGLDNLEGLGPLRLHDLRHNVVSWDVSRGVPLEIAGKNVGHRSRNSTEVYAHFAPDALKRAADERAKAMREAVDGALPVP